MNDRGAVTLFHFRGVPIRAHWTLLLIVPYLAVIFSVQFEQIARLAGVEHAHLTIPPLLWGALLAVGLFASVAIHEVAHTVLAIHFGGRVRSITLMLLGGVSQITRMPRRPRYEGLMAVAGPVTSLALGGLLLALHRLSRAAPADVEMGLFYLGYMNVVLGLFNLLPAFPMDGGRVLRAVLSARLGTSRATRMAAAIGRVTALFMGIVGLWAGNFLLLIIAIFVYFGAGAEAAGEQAREALDGLRIADLVPLIRRPPATISNDASLAEVLPRMHDAGRLDLVVTDDEGAPVTVIQAADLTMVGVGERHRLRVRDIARRFGNRHIAVSWDASANDVLEEAREDATPFIIVTDPAMTSSHGLVGLVAASDIETMLELRLAEQRRGPPAASELGTGDRRPPAIPPGQTHAQAR